MHLSRRQCWRLTGIADIARPQTLAVEEPQRTHLDIRMLRYGLFRNKAGRWGGMAAIGERQWSSAWMISCTTACDPGNRGHHCAPDISAVAALRQAARTPRPQKTPPRQPGRVSPSPSDLTGFDGSY